MKKRIYTRLVAGLLCGGLLFTEALSLEVQAVSNDLNAEQTATLEELGDESITDVTIDEETDEETSSEIETEEEKEEEQEELDEEEKAQDQKNNGTEEGKESVDEEDGDTLFNEEENELESVSENAVEEELSVDSVMVASAGDIASGSYGNITWAIDANGKLTVEGTGDFAESYYSFSSNVPDWSARQPWREYRELIKTAEISAMGISDASFMFWDCGNLTEVRMAQFDTSSVTSMAFMFWGCRSLQKLDLSQFVTSNVRYMNSMFGACENLTKLDFNLFDTANVADMNCMFEQCESLVALDLSHFDTSSVKNMNGMFENCKSMNILDISHFNTNNVTDMAYMFEGCESLTTLDLSHFNTDNVTDMHAMFMGCSGLKTLNTSRFNTGNVTNMSYMFENCCNLTALNLSHFNTSNVTDMQSMFGICSKLINLDISHFDTSKVKNMSGMFSYCYNLTELNIDNFDTANVTNMQEMFDKCESLTELNVSHFDTSRVKNMKEMFFNCVSLTMLDLSSFDAGNVLDAEDMLSVDSWRMYEYALTLLYTPYNLLQTVGIPSSSDKLWYRSNGTVVTELPQDLSYSVALGKNYIPPYKTPEEKADLLDNKESYVQKLTQVSLANTDEESRKSIQNGIYNLLFKAEFRPIYSAIPGDTMTFTGTEEALVKWPVQNKDYGVSAAYKARTVHDAQLGTVTYNEDAGGCKAYACFATAYLYKTSGSIHSCSTLTEEGAKTFIHQYVDPGEQLRYGSDATKFWHSIVFLGEKADGNGFYYISYDGGARNGHKPAHNMYLGYHSYKDFASLAKSKGNVFSVRDANGGSYLQGTAKTVADVRAGNGAETNILRLQCPVEAVVTLNGEALDSRNPGIASFGTVKRNGEEIIFSLSYSPDYNLIVIGTGEGKMTLIQEYYDGSGNLIDQRKFIGVPIQENREIQSGGFDSQATFSLCMENDEGEIVSWITGIGETVYSSTESLSSAENVEDGEIGIHYQDIPETGEIPNGLWISEVPDAVYTGAAIKPEVRVYDGEKRLKLNKDYTISYKNNAKAAQATDDKPPTVVVKGKGNYSGTETQTFNIIKRDISDTYVIKTFTDAYALPANGKNPALVFSAKCNNKTLKKNTDYTLTVKDGNGNEATSYATEGTYFVVVTGVGANYTGEYTLAFNVLNKIPVSKLKIGKIAAVEYDGKNKKPEPVIKYGNVTLNKGTDYSLRYQNNREMGTATIVITGKGDYFGTRNVTFAITGRQIKKAKFVGFKSSFPYTGDTIYQSETVLKYGEEDLVMGTDYTISYSNHLNKGKATVTYIGIGNYTGTMKKTYNIAAYNIATDAENRISLSTDEISTVFEKSGARPSVKVYDGTRILTEGKDYTLSYQNNTAVTTPTTLKQPTITVKGKGNFTGVLTEKKTYTITQKDIAEVTVTVPDVSASPKVGKYKSAPVLTDTNGKKLKVGTDYDKTYTYTYKNTTEKVINDEIEITRNAGDLVEEKDIIPANTVLCISIRAKEGGNYIGEKTAEYRIVTSPISKAKITVQNPDQNNKNLFSYTGQEIRIDKSNLIVKVGTDVLSDDQYEILEDSYKNNINKGTASVQIKGVGNLYGGTATVKFKIGTKGFRWFWRLLG